MEPTRSRLGLALGGIALIAALAPAPRAPAEANTLKSLAEARANVARKVADYYADRRLAPPAGGPEQQVIAAGEQVELWTRRNVDARLDAATGRDERVAILAEDLQRTRAIEARLKELAEGDPAFSKIDAFKAEFYRLDAEYRLEREKAGR